LLGVAAGARESCGGLVSAEVEAEGVAAAEYVVQAAQPGGTDAQLLGQARAVPPAGGTRHPGKRGGQAGTEGGGVEDGERERGGRRSGGHTAAYGGQRAGHSHAEAQARSMAGNLP
jgi:hypothetical protein